MYVRVRRHDVVLSFVPLSDPNNSYNLNKINTHKKVSFEFLLFDEIEVPLGLVSNDSLETVARIDFTH